MSIYRVKQLKEIVHRADRKELESFLDRILDIHFSESYFGRIATILTGDLRATKRALFCNLTDKKVVPYTTFLKLSQSPLRPLVRYLFEAAKLGEYQTPELMMEAARLYAANTNQQAFYVKTGISKTMKVDVGLLLQMGGFARKSLYMKERRQPVKAWKDVAGAGTTLDHRMMLVESTFRTELAKFEKPIAEEPPKRSMADLL